VTIDYNYYYPTLGAAEDTSTLCYNNDVIIGVYPESYVQSNQSDIKPLTIVTTNGNVPTNKLVGLKQLKKFKGIKFYTIKAPRDIDGERQRTLTIKGSFKPGDRIGSVRNITDIKQWYETGVPPSPNWIENHAFVFLDDEYNTAGTPNTCVNVKVEMEWIIQYKDLKPGVKYVSEPTHGNNCVHLRVGIDDVQFPYPLENHNDEIYDPAVPAYAVT